MTGVAPARAGSKLLGLEVIRFACALTVLIWHFQHFAMIGDKSGLARDHEPLAFLLWPIYEYGSFGVHIFWAISGFIFYWKYADAIAARTVAARRFFWLRFSRLYPLHFVTLLTVAALQPLYAALNGDWLVYENSFVSFALQLGLADQWAGSRAQSFNGPIWSVSAEVFVYVAFFLLMRAFGRRPLVIAGAIFSGTRSDLDRWLVDNPGLRRLFLRWGGGCGLAAKRQGANSAKRSAMDRNCNDRDVRRRSC